MVLLRQLAQRCTSIVIVLFGIVACNSPEANQPIAIDGSSTVFPITEAITKAYQTTEKEPVEVSVNVSG
ncbi:MAG: Phosphate transporter, periplasmic phosphate-binding protein PstS, partial [Cyanobacteriota bacterium]